jgi:spore coat polysaccharide biosynthesis predicted glycosyltransferase SpsG
VVQLDPDSPEAAALLAPAWSFGAPRITPTGPIHGVVLDGYELMESEAAALARRAPLVGDRRLPRPTRRSAALVDELCAVHLDGDHDRYNLPALLGPRLCAGRPALFGAAVTRDHTGRAYANVLVTMGRIDPDNLTGACLDLLDAVGLDARITVVASAEMVCRAGLDTRIRRPHSLVIDAADMVPLLGETDFVIGAGGVSLMERMASGIPSMTFTLINNQRLFVAGAAGLGVTVDGGESVGPECASLLDEILSDGAARAAMAAAGRRAVDGQGAARVASHLIALATETRGADRHTLQGHEA